MNNSGEYSGRSKLVGRFVTLAVALLALIFATLALFPETLGWFAGGTPATATGMETRVEFESFDIAVSGAQAPVDYSDEPGIHPDKITSYVEEESNGGYEVVGVTSGEHPSILFEMQTEHAAGDVENYALSPGSFGKISFDILPKANGEPLKVDIRFDYWGLSADRASDYAPQEIDASDYADVHELMCGHFLLFKSRTQITGTIYYNYSGCITTTRDGSAPAGVYHFDSTDSTTYKTFTPAASSADHRDHYTIEIYWVWPSTFAQLTAPASVSSHVHKLFNSENSASNAERQDLCDYIKGNPDLIFVPGDTNLTSVNFASLADGYEYDYYLFNLFTSAYNNADQYIGDNVKYVVLKADAVMAGD